MMTTTLTGLTTVFTPPSTCSSSWTYEAEFFNSAAGGLLLQNALPKYLDSECFPSGFEGAGRAPDTINLFSPGACSTGYTTATESFNGGTTLAICCQNDFFYSSTFSQKDQFNTSTVLFAGCLSTFTGGTTAVQGCNGADDSGLNFTTITGPVLMWGQPISVEFQQQDLTLFTSSSKSTSVGVSTNTLTTAQPSNTITQPYSTPTLTTTQSSEPNNPPSPSTASGLSAGAKAGIAIGTGFVGLLILCAVVFVFLRKRRAAKRLTYYHIDTKPWQRKEIDGSEIRHPVEMSGSRTSVGHIMELE